MLNVLVIDDSKTLRVGLAKMLREMGHTVTLAENGQQGVERFREQRPGLVLLDVTMPVMDGYATAREMRAQVLDDWVPIIFLSGSEDDQDLERAIEAGGDDCLQRLAKTFQQTCKRSSDLAARYGGEEFVLVLPATAREGASVVAETLRNNIEELRIAHERAPSGPYITISMGVAEYVPTQPLTSEMLIFQADQALYQAKQLGRNRVVVAGGLRS